MLLKTIAEYGPPVVSLLLPFSLLVWPWSPRPQGSILLRILAICLLGWILYAGIAWCRGQAWQIEFAQSGEVPDWDPAFGMAVYLAGGAVLTLIGAIPSMLIRGIIDAISSRRRKTNAQQGVAPQPAARSESDFSGSLPPST